MKSKAGKWVAKTNAIGLQAKAGRYGRTYAHSDIAFEFGMWMGAEFKANRMQFNLLKNEKASGVSR